MIVKASPRRSSARGAGCFGTKKVVKANLPAGVIAIFQKSLNSLERTGPPCTQAMVQWTSWQTSLGTEWCLEDAGEEMIGLQTRLISPLLTSGCTAISRWLKSCFKKSLTALRLRFTSPCPTALLRCFNKLKPLWMTSTTTSRTWWWGQSSRWRTRLDSALLLVVDHLREENCENLSPAECLVLCTLK